MSLASSRYESQSVVNTFNLFVDTERSSVYGHGHCKGDDAHIHLEGNSIEASDGEIIRLTLTNFTMFNNLYHINNTNRRIKLITNSILTNGNSRTNEQIIRLTPQNHSNYNTIVTDFATILGSALVQEAVQSGASTVTRFDYAQTVQPVGADNLVSGSRLMQFTLTSRDNAGSATSHHLNISDGVVLQCKAGDGESYQILGGKRIDSHNLTDQSFEVTLTATTVTVQGLFPMQRMSDPFVYLRCENVSNGLEMSVLDSGLRASGPDVVNSNIVAKVFRDVEFITYDSPTGNDYFLNLQQRRLSHLHLFLTDSKGRRLGRLPGAAGGTAAGRETATPESFESEDQSTQGNLYFTAVVKVEVIRVRNQSHLDTEPPPAPKPAREAQSVVVWPGYGRPRH